MDTHDDTHSISVSYIDPTIDRASIPLRPEEKLLNARRINVTPPQHALTPLEALQLLCQVDSPSDIGTKGPIKASAVFPEHENVQELRLFEVVFGRDSLICAQFVFDWFPQLMRSTIVTLSQLQGVRLDVASEEEPGRIIHEARDPNDPIAREITKQRGWGWPYYGTIDATPLFISALSTYVKKIDPAILDEQCTARDGQQKKIIDACNAALRWLVGAMGKNPQGFLESKRLNTKGGNIIQSWKDSADSHHHADGTLANINQGIASIEVQGLAYDALLDAAELYERLPHKGDIEPSVLREKASHLKQSVLEHLWVTDTRGPFFALGCDRDELGALRPLRVRTSNMGHLLSSRMLDGERELQKNVVEAILSPELLSPFGIRTLGIHENRFRPKGYHNGSVWLWDTFAISLGLLRQGYTKEARDLWSRIRQVVETTRRFPELISGENSTEPVLANRYIEVLDTKHNIRHAIEQPPQEIQAWTVASMVAIEHLEDTVR